MWQNSFKRLAFSGWQFAVSLIALAVLGLVVAFFVLEMGPATLLRSVYGVDYTYFFRAALQADDPYAVPGFYNPFWILPLVWLSELFGEYRLAVWVTVNLCCVVWVCVKLKMPLWGILPFLFFSGALMGAYVGNVEGLVMLGLVLPAPIGIVLLMLKPQIGLALTGYYVLCALVEHGWKRAALILVPVLVLFALSFIFYGDWFLKSWEVVGRDYNSINFFPLGVPVGVALIVAGVARRNVGYALMAIPLTTPYMIFHTWAFPFLGVVLVLVSEYKHLLWRLRNRVLRAEFNAQREVG